jgi:uncharacterized membrane protein YbaN (DUF454 family)
MNKIKQTLWFVAGMLLLGLGYIGLVTPGIPWSTPTVGAAYCFSKSNKKWHNWIMNHPIFGPFLRNWSEKRVFPTYGKWAMVATMDASLIIMWFTTHNWQLVLTVGFVMLLVAVWALKYPSTPEEYDERKAQGKKIGWF